MADANNRTPVRKGASSSNGGRARQTPTLPLFPPPSPSLENSAELLTGEENESGLGLHFDEEWDDVLAEVNEIQVVPEDETGHTYTFKNIPIKFPYEAYQSQEQMMEKIIEGVTTGEHCLLESPTGTGKTAALLCALLAWQKDCYNRGDYCESVIDAAVQRLGGCSCGFIKDKDKTKVILDVTKLGVPFLTARTPKPKPPEEEDSPVLAESTTLSDISMEMPPAPVVPTTPTKVLPLSSTSSPGTPVTPGKSHAVSPSMFESPLKRLKLVEDENMEVEDRWLDNLCGYCVRKYVRDRSRPPRIYYCTRTHSQIAQVVQQLKNTAYKRTPMTILASREPTCISELKDRENERHQNLTTQEKKDEPKRTINDICAASRSAFYKVFREKDDSVKEELWKGVCKYYFTKRDTPEMLAEHFTPFQQKGAFDLEDVKAKGVSCGQCPYYASYALHDSADIIFCSYNYLIDPSLRSTTNIHYANSIVVFDEAHNIEDLCRSAFTLTFDVSHFETNVKSLVDNLLKKNDVSKVNPLTIKNLNEVWLTFDTWSKCIQDKGNQLRASKFPYGFRHLWQEAQEMYENEEFMDLLEEMGLTAKNVQECLEKIGKPVMRKTAQSEDSMMTEETDFYINKRGERRPFMVSSRVTEFLQRLLQPLDFLCKEEEEGIGGVKDFKGYLTCKPNPRWNGESKLRRVAGTSADVQVSEDVPQFLYTFEIICLNPAVGFRALRNCTYSVIVSSGTLTPLQSFAGELDTKFGVTLQADHVIPRENVLAGVIGSGPTNQDLRLTYAFQHDKIKQDEIGRIICQICETVPNGILVFFPSYSFRNKLMERWSSHPRKDPVFDRIARKKLIFREESKDMEMFRRDMKKYKEEVKAARVYVLSI